MLKYPGRHGVRGSVESGASAESREAAPADERETRRRRERSSGGKTIFTGFGVGFVYKALK